MRVLSILFCALLAVGMVTGCSSDGTTEAAAASSRAAFSASVSVTTSEPTATTLEKAASQWSLLIKAEGASSVVVTVNSPFSQRVKQRAVGLRHSKKLLAGVRRATWPASALPKIRAFLTLQARWCTAQTSDLQKFEAGSSTPDRSALLEKRTAAEVAVTTALGG